MLSAAILRATCSAPGKDVTLLARGAWAEEIQKNGLRIKDKFSPRMSVTRIPVVTELKPEDQYDVIFVVMRYTQVGSVMDALHANPAKNIVFVGNDVRAEGDRRHAAGEERSLCLCALRGTPRA